MQKTPGTLFAPCALALGVSASCFAAPKIGVVDPNTIINNYPGIKEIVQSIESERARLGEEFKTQSANMNEQDKAVLLQKLNKQMADFEQKKMNPVRRKINKTILTVANTHGLEDVVNVNAMVAGGKDLTQEVITALK